MSKRITRSTRFRGTEGVGGGGIRSVDGFLGKRIPDSPEDGLDPIATVVVVELKGRPVVYRTPVIDAEWTEFVTSMSASVEAAEGLTARYTLDGSDGPVPLAILPANLLLSRGYTGAFLGLYGSTNGREAAVHADFDWVRYQAFPRS